MRVPHSFHRTVELRPCFLGMGLYRRSLGYANLSADAEFHVLTAGVCYLLPNDLSLVHPAFRRRNSTMRLIVCMDAVDFRYEKTYSLPRPASLLLDIYWTRGDMFVRSWYKALGKDREIAESRKAG